MPDSASEIIARLFDRAARDPDAAPLAASFAQAHDAGRWRADELERLARDLVDERARLRTEERVS